MSAVRVLVTGATGFVGQAVIRDLIRRPGLEIIATALEPRETIQGGWVNNVRYHSLDLFAPEIFQQNLFQLFGRPEILIHLAWKGLPNYEKLFHFEENLFPGYQVIKHLVSNGLKKVAAIGTCLEYGLQSGCLTEDHEARPITPYGLAKDTMRKFLDELRKVVPFDFNWIRLFYLHGEGQAKSSLLSQLQAALDAKKEVFNMSVGEQLRDYLPIEIAAAYIVKIALQNEVSGIVNCCSGVPISVRRFVEEYLERTKQHIRLNRGYYPYPTYEPMAFWGDPGRLSKACKAFATAFSE